MRLRSILMAAPLALALPAWAQQPTPQPGEQLWDRVVAVVGDTTLLYSDVLMELEAMQAQGQTVPTDPAQRAALVRDIVARRVDDLMLLEAARAAAVEVEATDVLGAVERQIQQVQQGFGSEEAFLQALQQSGRTMQEYRQTLTQQYTDQTMIQRFMQQRVQTMAPPPVSEDEIRQFFEAQRERLGSRPATVSLQQAILKPQPSDSARTAARRRADEILAELRRGGDFEVLARRHSQDPSAPQGGMLGWFRQGQMVRPFEAMAYALRPGETSPVVETEFGYHIIKLEKARGPERQARHILIRPEVTDADVARTRALADSVAAAARAGASLTELAERHGTPADQRIARDVVLDRLPPAYGTTVAAAEVGAVVGPFELNEGTGPSFVVAKVTGRQAEGAYTLADVREQVRERVVQQKQIERLLAELRQNTHIRISL
ncbi:MAG TPA: peptidylprolyl isomerase [Longimicrobiaceae bacterium]|nr:peptidylprolyl isomerase [Longimicrobiaceae bacterium]